MAAIDGLVTQAQRHKRALHISPEPRLRAVILTCMDARIDPAAVFGIEPGDVHVLRNAGARATPDVLRSVALSQAILGTREVLVMGHTGCGLLKRTESELSEAIRSASGEVPAMVWGGFHDLDGSVAEAVETLAACRFIAHRSHIRGFIYELETGVVRPAGEAQSSRAVTHNRAPLSGLGGLRADVLNLRRESRR